MNMDVGAGVRRGLVVVIAMMTVGCAPKHHQGVNLRMDLRCVNGVVLEDCDLGGEIPRCKKTRVNFNKGCGVVEVVK